MTAADDDDGPSLLRRTAAWAWARDEVGEEATAETVRYTGVMYLLAIVIITLVGALLAAFGYETLAFALLLFGIFFVAFIGAINVSWEFLKYRSARRRAAGIVSESTGPDRELSVDIQLAEDTKIGFLVTVVGLVVLYAAFELARWFTGLV